MTEMFKSFDELPSDYIPNNRPILRPIKPIVNKTHSLSAMWPLYNAKGEIMGAEWNYGDAFDLPFEVRGNIISDDGELLDLEEYFTGKTLKVDILDHFFNDYKTFTLNCSAKLYQEKLILLLEFTEEVSKAIPKGTYHIRLTLDDTIIYSPRDSILNVR